MLKTSEAVFLKSIESESNVTRVVYGLGHVFGHWSGPLRQMVTSHSSLLLWMGEVRLESVNSNIVQEIKASPFSSLGSFTSLALVKGSTQLLPLVSPPIKS